MQTQSLSAKLEHVNLTVSDADKVANTFSALFDWKVRWSGVSMDDGYTVHVGNDQCYIALYTRQDLHPTAQHGHRRLNNLNHIAVLVNDLGQVQERAIALGLEPFNHGEYQPGKRFYVVCHDQLEIEIVSYND